MNTNYNTTTATTQPTSMVWMLDLSEPIDETLVETKRDSDGRILKQHCKLETAKRSHYDADEDLATKFDVSVDELFAGSKVKAAKRTRR